MSSVEVLSLIVLRVSDIHRSAEFYSTIGLEFVRERHGDGPEHLSALVGRTVLELYPSSEKFPASPLRLGFCVSSIETVFAKCRQAGGNILSEPKVPFNSVAG